MCTEQDEGPSMVRENMYVGRLREFARPSWCFPDGLELDGYGQDPESYVWVYIDASRATLTFSAQVWHTFAAAAADALVGV